MQLYLICVAAAKAKVSVSTVRSYCRQGLVDPIRDSAARRLFTDDDIQQIRQIYMDKMHRRLPAVRRELAGCPEEPRGMRAPDSAPEDFGAHPGGGGQ